MLQRTIVIVIALHLIYLPFSVGTIYLSAFSYTELYIHIFTGIHVPLKRTILKCGKKKIKKEEKRGWWLFALICKVEQQQQQQQNRGKVNWQYRFFKIPADSLIKDLS